MSVLLAAVIAVAMTVLVKAVVVSGGGCNGLSL